MIPLVAPTITGYDRQYIRQRLAEGLLEDETEVARFEEAFCDLVGCQAAVALCSGTAALAVAYGLIGFDRLVLPTYACSALRNAASDIPCEFVDVSFDVVSATAT